VDSQDESDWRETCDQRASGHRQVPHEDDDDLTVCTFDLKHKAEGVPATRMLSYGPDDFMTACAECAAFFEQTT
jgi:hypothetical protein